MSVVVVGSVNADLLTRVQAHPAPGETVLGESLAVLAGGKGANQAVAAARLGARVAMIGAVGDDEFAQAAMAGLRASGVDLTSVAQVPGPTGIAIVTVADGGENSIVVVPGANASVDAGVVAARSGVIADAGVVVLQGEIPRDGIEAAARAARGRVVINLAPVLELDPEVLRLADPLVVNEHEARAVLRGLAAAPDAPDGPDGSNGSDGRHDDDDAVARSLLAAGVRSVVVTLGAAGALVATTTAADGDTDVTRVPSPRVAATDTTGAGDAFVGALAHRLAAGDGLVDAARFAARVGAYAVTGAGAQPSFPSSDDPLPAPA